VLVFSIALLAIGLILLLIEALLPGFSIPGVTGVIAIICSFIITILYFPFMYGLFIVLCELVGVAAAAYAVFKILKRKQLINKFILEETLDYEKNDIGGLDYFLGKEGITKTALRPYGSADFNGFTADVCSDGNFILVNKKIKVVKIDDSKIIVKEVSEVQN
jgi:membrane-bound serine protease (ClpP class)